jgi:hypothetical protein
MMVEVEMSGIRLAAILWGRCTFHDVRMCAALEHEELSVKTPPEKWMTAVTARYHHEKLQRFKNHLAFYLQPNGDRHGSQENIDDLW